MQINWQTIMTLLIVGVCAIYLLRRILNLFVPSGKNQPAGCGSCSQSTSINKPKVTPLVELTTRSEENSTKAEDQQANNSTLM